jgi:hypothetical protein
VRRRDAKAASDRLARATAALDREAVRVYARGMESTVGAVIDASERYVMIKVDVGVSKGVRDRIARRSLGIRANERVDERVLLAPAFEEYRVRAGTELGALRLGRRAQ